MLIGTPTSGSQPFVRWRDLQVSHSVLLLVGSGLQHLCTQGLFASPVFSPLLPRGHNLHGNRRKGLEYLGSNLGWWVTLALLSWMQAPSQSMALDRFCS